MKSQLSKHNQKKSKMTFKCEFNAK